MVTGINSADSSDMQLMMAQFYQKLNAADTDGTKGLSLDELSSVDTTNDAGGTAFLKSLTDQFSQLDADGNGQLSSSEISQAKPPTQPMGPPPGLDLGISNTTDSTKTDTSNSTNATSKTSSTQNESIEQMLKKLMSEIFEKLADGISGEKKSSSDSSDSQSKTADSVSTDTNGAKKGVSLSDLSSIKTNTNAGATDFINSLMNDFKNLDTDGDGKLSQSELAALKTNSGAETASSKLGNDLSSLGSTLGSASSAFMGKLISSYQNGNLSNLASSLSLAI